MYIKFDIVKIRPPIKSKSTEWRETCTEWRATINGQSFTYYTGSAIKNKPTQDDVLHALCSDAEWGNYSFNEFCDNLGYDNDSLKAFDIYRACMETAEKLRKLKINYIQELERLRETGDY